MRRRTVREGTRLERQFHRAHRTRAFASCSALTILLSTVLPKTARHCAIVPLYIYMSNDANALASSGASSCTAASAPFGEILSRDGSVIWLTAPDGLATPLDGTLKWTTAPTDNEAELSACATASPGPSGGIVVSTENGETYQVSRSVRDRSAPQA